jgi:hypothetical protein
MRCWLAIDGALLGPVLRDSVPVVDAALRAASLVRARLRRAGGGESWRSGEGWSLDVLGA